MSDQNLKSSEKKVNGSNWEGIDLKVGKSQRKNEVSVYVIYEE